MRGRTTDRWRERPVATWCVRALVASLPVGTSIASGFAASRALPSPVGLAGHVSRLALVVACSAVTFFVVGRGARRLLPLTMLLQLSLLFPDQAPSRFRIALRAGNPRRLREWAQCQAESGVAPDAARQAETVLTLIVALGAHDRRTRGHSERVQALTDLMAQSLALPTEAVDRLRWAALLHDIGKLSVPAKVLNLPGRPNAAELRTIRRHPVEGARIAEPLASWLGEWRHAIDQHHERFDGTGYPEGLSGTEISLAGRIVAVTDAFETMTAVRSYKKAMSVRDARTELVDSAGSHFDPSVVRTFVDISIGKLRWTLGLVATLAELPLIGLVPRAATIAGNAAAAAPPLAGLGGAAIVGLGVLTLPGATAVAQRPVPSPPSATTTPAVNTVTASAPSPNPATAAVAAPVPAPVAAAAGNAAQTLLNRLTGAIGSPLAGLRNPLTLPGATVGPRLPLP